MTFYIKIAEIVEMYSNFWENVRGKIKDKKDGQKWLSETSGVGRTAINNGIGKLNKQETAGRQITNSPSVDNAYAIAKALEVSIEELVDGEDGAEYVRKLYANKGLLWEPPGRIADIVAVLKFLDDVTLDTVRKMVLPLGEKGEAATAG